MAPSQPGLRGHSFQIRPLADCDLDDILAVYRQCADFLALGPQPTATPDMVRQDLARSAAEGGVFCGIYAADGQPIGVVDFVPRRAGGRPEHAFFSLLMIAAPHRRQGIGREVVALIEGEAKRDPGVTAILTAVQLNNPAAIRFWHRSGYEIAGGPALQPDGTTTYLLRKELTHGETIPSLPHPTRILSVRDDSPTVRTFVLGHRLRAEPGQFVMAWLPGVDEKPFSLVRADPVTLAIARVGPFTAAVHRLGPGDRLWLRGPLGRPFTLPQAPAAGLPPRILLIAGGYGAAPLHFLAERALAIGREVHVVIGARTAADVILADRFSTLGAEVVVTTDDGTLGRQGLATEAAEWLLARAAYQALYACGPEPMLVAAEALARAHRLPAQLSYERTMRCGFGVCGSCARDGWLVCRDGPVRSIPGKEP